MKKLHAELADWPYRAEGEMEAHKAFLFRINTEKMALSVQKTVFGALVEQKKETIFALQEQLAQAVAFDGEHADITQALAAFVRQL